jgi:Uma2 family endonuclease
MPFMTPTQTAPAFNTMADVLEQLGNISPRRVRLHPMPGTATEEDLLRVNLHEDCLCELVDGVLVEKVMGMLESSLAVDLIYLLRGFIGPRNLGFLSAPDGPFRLMPKLVRYPDVAFVSWEQLPSRERPTKPMPDLAPALAIEILSEGNTEGEMDRKLRDYFVHGVKLVWQVDPSTRTVQVFTAPDESITLKESDTLTGGDVLPGFAVPVREVFAGLPPAAPQPRSKHTPRKPRRRGK